MELSKQNALSKNELPNVGHLTVATTGFSPNVTPTAPTATIAAVPKHVKCVLGMVPMPRIKGSRQVDVTEFNRFKAAMDEKCANFYVITTPSPVKGKAPIPQAIASFCGDFPQSKELSQQVAGVLRRPDYGPAAIGTLIICESNESGDGFAVHTLENSDHITLLCQAPDTSHLQKVNCDVQVSYSAGSLETVGLNPTARYAINHAVEQKRYTGFFVRVPRRRPAVIKHSALTKIIAFVRCIDLEIEHEAESVYEHVEHAIEEKLPIVATAYYTDVKH